ncbi:MAG: hypothetical protein ACK5P5_00255, partial [Pseudobdellovibrionaceae bacterium]
VQSSQGPVLRRDTVLTRDTVSKGAFVKNMILVLIAVASFQVQSANASNTKNPAKCEHQKELKGGILASTNPREVMRAPVQPRQALGNTRVGGTR